MKSSFMKRLKWLFEGFKATTENIFFFFLLTDGGSKL